jgi:excisionase family DNA binding protein
MPERWLSVDEIAAHLGVNPDTIYKWITRELMPAHKVGRLWKFLASKVDEWVKGGLAGETEARPAAPESKATSGTPSISRPTRRPSRLTEAHDL